MRHLRNTIAGRGRVARLLIAGTLVAGGIGAPVLLAAGTASAAACGTATAAGTPCQLTGTLDLTSGALTLTSPTALGWGATVNGLDQQLVDSTPAQQTYLVDDSTGNGAGWDVTSWSTAFTNTTSSATLPSTAFSTNGSLSSITATTAPAAACATGSTCTLPTDTTVYPVTLTAGAAAAEIFSTPAATGLGAINISSVGWWLSVPANTAAGTYTATVNLSINSGP
jgi:hypothetical protein